MSGERVLGFVEEACRDAIVAALDAARDEAARRVIATCGCGQEGGCERIYSQEWPPAEWDIGCARFVRAVRGEG